MPDDQPAVRREDVAQHLHAAGAPGHAHDDHGHGLDDHDHDHDDHTHDQSHEDHTHEHGHDEHGHGHDEHGHGHDEHGHGGGLKHALLGLVVPHSHDPGDATDPVLEGSRQGLRALGVSLAILAVTAGLQVLVYLLSGSVALLADTIHNAADALTAVPLGIAFVLGRRRPNRRYTYGYGRAEDLAGIVVVALIAASSVLAAVEAMRRLVHPAPPSHLIAVTAAGLVGFLGNELVATYRIRVGRQIGSAALVADGLHARTDGLTSLAVVLGAAGTALGWSRADPVVGLLITVMILLVLWQAAREVYRRLMDAVDPDLVDQVESVLAGVPQVAGVGPVRLRWIGHALRAEVSVRADGELSLRDAHDVAEDARHRLLHEVHRLFDATVHVDPVTGDGYDPHASVAHHPTGEPRSRSA